MNLWITEMKEETQDSGNTPGLLVGDAETETQAPVADTITPPESWNRFDFASVAALRTHQLLHGCVSRISGRLVIG